MAFHKEYGLLKRQPKPDKIDGFNLNRKLISLVIMLSVAGLFIAFQTNSSKVGNDTEEVFLDIFAPIGSIFSNLRSDINYFTDYIGNLQLVLNKPEIFKTLNERNNKLQSQNTQLAYENALLREELVLAKRNPLQSITARVLTHPDYNNSNRIIIAGGANKGIKKGLAVITSAGVVGKVDRVSANYSRVNILTSSDSRIPSSIGTIRLNAIVSGNDTSEVDIIIKEHDTKIADGEKVLTSGRGGIFPYGLLIGYVKGSKVKTAVDLNKLDYVQVIKNSEQSDLDDH